MSQFLNALQDQAERLEKFTIDVIYDRRDGRAAKIWGGFLRGLSHLFHGIVILRSRLYQTGVLRSQHLGCLVIVVGNLTVGGTGKTPVVEKLARSLRDQGRKVAILSRGYKSKKEPLLKKWIRAVTHTEPAPPRIVSDGRRVLLDSEVAGDEPYMLARNLPGVLVITDKDRVKAGQYAIKRFGVDTLILDDGFQYYRMKDHLQLLLIDKTNPFGNGSVLPRGILREPIRHMKRASYIFLTKSDGRRDSELESVIQAHRPGTELIECTHRPMYLQDVFTDKKEGLERLRGMRVIALSAIAAPESFEAYLERYEAEVVERFRFIDHHRFSDRELERIIAVALDRQVDAVLTTEKDAVRIPRDCEMPVPFFFLRVEIDILTGVKDFEAAVARICFPKKPLRATRAPFLTGKSKTPSPIPNNAITNEQRDGQNGSNGK